MYLLKTILPYIPTLLVALLVAYVGYLLGLRRVKAEKQLEFIVRQIQEFYSPMISCLLKIRANTNVEIEISKKSDIAWRKICDSQPEPFLNSEERFTSFKAEIDYNNN